MNESIQPGLPWWLSVKESACQSRRCGFEPWVEKTPWRRKWQPIPVFLPGKCQGQRSLAGCNLCCHKRVRYDLVTKQQQFNNSYVMNIISKEKHEELGQNFIFWDHTMFWGQNKQQQGLFTPLDSDITMSHRTSFQHTFYIISCFI